MNYTSVPGLDLNTSHYPVSAPEVGQKDATRIGGGGGGGGMQGSARTEVDTASAALSLRVYGYSQLLPALEARHSCRTWRERVLYVMHLAAELSVRKRMRGGFFPLSSRKLGEMIGREHVASVLGLLVEAGLLETDGFYQPRKKCRWFRLSGDYGFEEIVIRGPFAKRIAMLRAKHSRPPIAVSEIHAPIWESLKKLSIPEEAVSREIKLLASRNIRKAGLAELAARKIRMGEWSFQSDKTGRVHNNFTNLPKTLRRWALLGGERIAEIDISNCQPTLLASLYPTKSEEYQRFIRIVSDGEFYEYLNAASLRPKLDRKKMKTAIFAEVLFNRPKERFLMWNAFQKCFPQLALEISRINQKAHNQLALALQKREAEIVIGRVVPRIASELVCPILTLHDSIAVPERVKEAAAKIFSEVLREELGFEAKLEITVGS